MLYPNRIQAALLLDQPVTQLAAIVRDFQRIEGMRSGAQFNVPEENPGRFVRLFNGAEELMVTFEYCDYPCDTALFRPALSSAFVGIATPDIRERIARSHSHILIEVSHGVMAGVEDNPEIAAMFEAIGRPRAGATQAQFERRIAVLALMGRIAAEHAMPLAVHWTQSDMLLGGDLFDALAGNDAVPGALHIHPFLFGPHPAPGEDALVGIRTFGARHWLGREIIVQPSALPWATNLETIFAFLKIATMPGGYVIPDGDSFGPEDRSLSYRVRHHDRGADIGYAEPEPADVPFYELIPLRHVAHGFTAPDHVPDANAFDDRAFPVAVMPPDQDDRMTLANEWAGKRRMAEAIGGRFEVRKAGLAAPAAPPSPSPPAGGPPRTAPPMIGGHGPRGRVFGRKGL